MHIAHVLIPVTVNTCVWIGCTPRLCCYDLLHRWRPADPVFRLCWPVFTSLLLYDEKSRDRRRVQTGGAISRHCQVRRCWIKTDSAIYLGEMPSAEFMLCLLWVIRLMKTVESICCAVRHTVTLPRAVWRMIRSPHSVWVLTAMTMTNAGHHQPSAMRTRMPAVCSVSVIYCAVVPTSLLLSALLLAASYIFLVTFAVLYYVTDSFFPIVPLSISLDTVLSHNYRITPVIKVIFWFQSCLLIISRSPHRLTAAYP